jgi:hypothetical protein
MHDLQSTLTDNRQAVGTFLTSARAVPQSAWTQPRAPGKWSPGQVIEHVAIAYEIARAILNGTFSGRAAPRLLRPLIRTIVFNPILKTGRFGKGVKAPAPFLPTASPASVADLTPPSSFPATWHWGRCLTADALGILEDTAKGEFHASAGNVDHRADRRNSGSSDHTPFSRDQRYATPG